MGNALAGRGDFVAAAESHSEALRLRPSSFEAANGLAQAQLQAGQTERAVAAYRDAIRLRSSSAETHRQLGQALVDLDHNDEALIAFEEALRLDPGDVIAKAERDRIVEEKHVAGMVLGVRPECLTASLPSMSTTTSPFRSVAPELILKS